MATAGTKSLLSATEYLHRAVTTATTGAPRQTSRPDIQAPSDHDDGENSNNSDNDEQDNIRRTTRHIKSAVLAITRWVLLIRASSTSETGGLGTMPLQFLLKIFLITDLVSTVLLPLLKWTKTMLGYDHKAGAPTGQLPVTVVSGLRMPP